jgi:DNA-binding transcriptional LysR family regulator
MTLTQLRYLVAIADAELNITLAASRVHATQPGLSKQLKQLEDELGFLLFVRKGRSLESVTRPAPRSSPAPARCWPRPTTSAPTRPTSAARARAS